MRTQIVFYSLGGTTRKLAETLAKALGADISEIRCKRYGPGLASFLRASYDSLTAQQPAIEIGQTSPQAYDLVLVGAPLWAGHVATPVRTYLNERRGQFKRIAFFLSHGASPTERAFAEMGQLAGAAPKATIALRTANILNADCDEAVDDFINRLKQAA